MNVQESGCRLVVKLGAEFDDVCGRGLVVRSLELLGAKDVPRMAVLAPVLTMPTLNTRKLVVMVRTP